MQQGLELALRAMGVVYVLGSLAGLRQVVMDHLMDQMISGISLKPMPFKDRQRRWLLGSSLFAIGMGGMALMVLSLWALPLFLFGLGTQAFYLVWARTAFPPEDDADRTGRRQTGTATLIYAAATLLVCLAAAFGRLHPWLDPWALAIPVTGLLLGLYAGRHMLWASRRRTGPSWDASEPEPYEIPPPPARVRLAPTWGCYPLRNADTGNDVIYDDYLPRELADRLYEWSLAFHASDDHEAKEFWAEFVDDAAEAAHRSEGEAIVAELRSIFLEAEGPDYPADIRHVGPSP